MSSLKHAIGLDIGTRNARAVWLTLQKGGPHLDRVEHIAFPADEQEVPKTLRKWLEQNGLTNAFCALSLPGSATVFQPGRIAPNDPRTPEQVAAIDIATYNEMAGDTMGYAIASQPDPFNTGVRLTLMAMVKQATLARTLQTAEQNHIRPLDLTPAPVALFNACEASAAERRQPHLYIEIGHTQTEVSIGLPTGLLFSRSLPIAGKAFTDALASVQKIPFQQAETRKHTHGLNPPDDEAAAKALRAVADRWLAQLNGCLSVYRSSFPAKDFAPCAVKITGGGARLRGFPDLIAAHIKLPLLPTSDNEPPAIAHGLALAMLRPPVTGLSLLPATLRYEVFFKQQKPWWIATAAMLALTVGVLIVSGMVAISRSNKILAAERAELEARRRVDVSIQELRKKAGVVAQHSEPVKKLLHNALLARQALTLACQSVGPEDDITLFCDIESYVPPAPPTRASSRSAVINRNPSAASLSARRPAVARAPAAPPVPSNPAALTSFIIEGYTTNPDMTTVRDMINRLKSSPLTANADLIRDDLVHAPVGSESLEPGTRLPSYRHFVIQLDLNP